MNEEQVQLILDDCQKKLEALVPKGAGPFGARNPKEIAQMRMIGSIAASNLMTYGLVMNNQGAQRWGMYINGQIGDPVKWEELLTAIYGPA